MKIKLIYEFLWIAQMISKVNATNREFLLYGEIWESCLFFEKKYS